MKERHPEQRRGLEGCSEPDAQIAVLDLVDRARSDAGPGCELVLRPAPLPPRKPDFGAQETRRVNGVWRVGALTLRDHKAE